MFKTAATKIAHNSTIPALGGNHDLRPLQDLITAEKTVLISLQKLSVDYSKAAEALRTWGLSEGDDLGDILSASTNVLNHFSTALSQYASHGHSIRDQLKAIRSREEALDELKRRRRAVVRKADDAEKKLSKMSPEHKNLPMQTDLLNRLQAEIRQMDSEILLEEAALADFKRSATRSWMGLKFGGLLECCEKGMIAAELGKHVIGEISEEATQPGLPRAMYYGHQKVESYVSEAYRRINEVSLSTVPSVGFRDRFPPTSDGDRSPAPWNPHGNKPQPPAPIIVEDDFQAPLRPYAGAGDLLSPPQGSASSLGTQSLGARYQEPSSASSNIGPGSAFSQPGHERQSTDDFGVRTRSGTLESPNSGGGRFATFPVKQRPPGSAGGFTLSDPPSLSSRNEPEESFSASIAQALGDPAPQSSSLNVDSNRLQPTSPAWETHNIGPTTPGSFQGTEETSAAMEDGPTRSAGINSTTSSAFAPTLPPISITTPSDSQTPPSAGSGSGLPPGAAPPDPWAQPNRHVSPQGPAAGHNREISNTDPLLAYMLSSQDNDNDLDDDLPSPAPTQMTIPIIDPRLQVEETAEQRLSRHVRFGQVEDVDAEIEKRVSLEKERRSLEESGQATQAQTQASAQDTPSPAGSATAGTAKPSLENEPASPKPDSVTPAPAEASRDVAEAAPAAPETDERALNAAAARGISLELEALKGNPPVPEKGPISPSQRGGPPARMNNFNSSPPFDDHNSGREPSPLIPPQALFAKRSVSPHPYAELNNNSSSAPFSHYSPQQQQPQAQAPYQPTPSYRQQQPAPAMSAAQTYAQAYQSTSYQPPPPQQQEYTPPANNLPPRLQALNNPPDNPVPPRFQNLNGRPGGNNVPPRFQTGGPAQVPATIVAEPDPILSPPNAEFSRPLGSLQFNRSNVSLNSGTSPLSPPAPGTRTISAAAFKRPIRNNTADSTGGTPPPPPFGEPFARKALPTSPREFMVGSPPAASRDQSAIMSQQPPSSQHQYDQPPPPAQYQQSPSQYQQPNSQYQQQQTPAQYQQPPLQYQRPPSQYQQPQSLNHYQQPQQRPVSEFEEYDYISAYVNNSNPNSPSKGEFGGDSNAHPGAGPPYHDPAGGHPQRGGYGDNRYGGHDTGLR